MESPMPRRRIGLGDCDCHVDLWSNGHSFGDTQKYHGEGPFLSRVWKVLQKHLEEQTERALLVSLPFVSLCWWNVIVLSCYHVKVPEIFHMSFHLMLPSPLSIFIVPDPSSSSTSHLWIRLSLGSWGWTLGCRDIQTHVLPLHYALRVRCATNETQSREYLQEFTTLRKNWNIKLGKGKPAYLSTCHPWTSSTKATYDSFFREYTFLWPRYKIM